jgi:hypothetical protein
VKQQAVARKAFSEIKGFLALQCFAPHSADAHATTRYGPFRHPEVAAKRLSDGYRFKQFILQGSLPLRLGKASADKQA